jgi:hypothetical protein
VHYLLEKKFYIYSLYILHFNFGFIGKWLVIDKTSHLFLVELRFVEEVPLRLAPVIKSDERNNSVALGVIFY